MAYEVALRGTLGAHYDFVETPEGEFGFLEVNPGDQWGWAQERLGIPLAEELIRALASTPRAGPWTIAPQGV